MDSARGTAALPAVGFPIRTSPDQSLVSGSPTLFAATHVLLRLLSPRHPSCALCSLVIVSLPWRTLSVGSIAVPLMHALRSGGRAASTRVELAPPWTPPTAQGSSDPRRPGSSAAPWLTGDTPTTTQLLPTSCLRICGCQRTPILVEPIGIEPTTSSLQSWRSPS